MRSGSTKLGAVAVGIACAAALLAYYLVGYLMVRPPAVAAFDGQGAGAPDAADGRQLRPCARPRLGQLPRPGLEGHWRHTTIYKVPGARARQGHDLQYDGASGLRNPLLARSARHRRRHGDQRQAHPDRRPRFARTPSRSPTSTSACRCRASPTTPRTSAASRLHARRGPQHDHLQLPRARARHLPLAVLRALRLRLPPGATAGRCSRSAGWTADRGRVSEAASARPGPAASRATGPHRRRLGAADRDRRAARDLGRRAAHPARRHEPAVARPARRRTSS